MYPVRDNANTNSSSTNPMNSNSNSAASTVEIEKPPPPPGNPSNTEKSSVILEKDIEDLFPPMED